MLKYRINKALKPLFLLLSLAVLTSGNALASGGSSSGEGFNAGEMIMHHVTDAHEIHLWTLHENTKDEHHISIPLPVIIYSVDDGLKVFMSSSFEHGHKEVDGYILHDGHIWKRDLTQSADHAEQGFLAENWGGIFSGQPGAFIDISLTKTATGILLTVFIMFFVFLSIAKAYKRNPNEAPKGMQSLMEPIILFVRDEIAKPSVGPRYEAFLPYLLTIFFFIWTANMLGLIPFIGGFNVTGNIAVTLVLALFTFIITNVSGNKYYWKHIFAPDIPIALYILMIPIEIMGVFIKPIVLCARLFANITAGHIIILAFMSLIFIFANQYGTGAGYGVSIVSLAFAIFMNIMEILVAFLQAYVFTLLSALYFGAAVEEHH